MGENMPKNMQVEILTCEKFKDKYIVTVKENPFYIDGKGGQLGDRGTISGIEILENTEKGILVSNPVELGIQDYNIYENRKIYIKENHTAQHLFSAVAYNDFGLNTVAFRMGVDYTTVDIDSQEISLEIMEAIEKKVNDTIQRAIPLDIYTLTHDEAMKKEGLRRQIKEKVTGDVRFIEIPGVDISACAGYHVENTKDIRLFKILYWEKIKGECTRFYFIAGYKAFEDYKFKHQIIRDLCHRFSSKENEIIEMVGKVFQDRKNLEGQLKNVSIKYAELLSQELIKNPIIFGQNQIIFYDEDQNISSFLSRNIDLDKYLLITEGDGASYTVMSNIFNCKELLKFILSRHSSLKGGGSETKGNFKGEIKKEELLDTIKLYFENL